MAGIREGITVKYFGGDKPYIAIAAPISDELLDAFIAFEQCLGELFEKYGVSQEYDEKLRAAVERIERQSANDALHRGYKCALLGWEQITDLLIENPDEAAFTID